MIAGRLQLGRYPGRLQILMEEFQRRMMLGDAAQQLEMAQRWLRVEAALEATIELVAKEAREMATAGNPVNRAALYELRRYRILLGQAKSETQKYQRWAAESIGERQGQLVGMGAKDARNLIRASYMEAGATVARFDYLPKEAVEAMIGYASNGTPLYDLLIKSYPDSIDGLTEALIEATAKGINPRQTAKLMEKEMAGNLQRSLTVARTEQLRAYRRAGTEQMKASGVVDGWIWRSAMQSTTCLACIAMDGTEHDLDEELDDHPNGRCFKQPKISGLEPVEARSSEDWFRSQTEERQTEMMGDKLFEAWKEGQVGFGDLAGVVQSEEWGSHVHVKSL